MTLPGNRKLVPTSGHARIHSDAQEAGLELTDGQLLPVSSADEARLRWNLAANRLEASFSGGPWVKVVSGDASGLVNDTEPGAVNGYGVVPRHALVSDAATPGGIWTPYDDLGIGVVYSVPTLVALGTLPSAALPDGAKVFVYEPGVENLYVLDTVGAHTVTGDTVIAALNGGYWLSRFEGRWDDLQGSLSQGAAVGALTYENYRATAYKMNFFRHDQNDELSFGYQMPHKWKYTTSVNPHLHVVPMADPALAQVAYFNGYYVWTNIDTTEIPDVGGWTMFAVEFTINPGDVFQQLRVPLGVFAPPPSARESSCLLLYMRRNGTDPLDTYNANKVGGTVAANLGLLSADLHYQASWMGTPQPGVSL
jgi:hypothetical protein